ncbi:MAG: hypothetical protein R6V35_01910 [Candidatus Nanohaloarchaea archaeon]
MSNESFSLYAPLQAESDASELQRVIDKLLEEGFSTERTGDSRECRYSSRETDFDYSNADFDSAIDEIKDGGIGSIQLWRDEDFEFTVTFNLEGYVYQDQSNVAILFDPVYFRRDSDVGFEENISTVLKLAEIVFETLRPPYLTSLTHFEDQNYGINSLEDPINHAFWLICVSDDYRELDADSINAWGVRDLENGKMLVLSDDWINNPTGEMSREEAEKRLWEK